MYPANKMNYELDQLHEVELQHLEQEFANYKEIYPQNQPNKNK